MYHDLEDKGQMQTKQDELYYSNKSRKPSREEKPFFSLRTKDFDVEDLQGPTQIRHIDLDKFVGRENEKKLMEGAIERSLNHQFSLVIVEGKSGMVHCFFFVLLSFLKKKLKKLSFFTFFNRERLHLSEIQSRKS